MVGWLRRYTFQSLLFAFPTDTVAGFAINSRTFCQTSRRCHRSGYHHHSSHGMMMEQPSIETTESVVHDDDDDENILKRLGLPQPLLLGSGSFTRQLILKEMGIDFIIVVRPIEEQDIGDRTNDTPEQLVLTLAKAKADHLVQKIQQGNCQTELAALNNNTTTTTTPSYIVLTGDQVVVHGCGDERIILEKPTSIAQAESFCALYAKSPPSTVGSCVLTHIPSGLQLSGVDTATIHFRPSVATTHLVQRLVEDKAPILSCAGGLMIEHPFVREHLERIDGTEDSVMGLSKNLVRRLLQQLSQQLN